MKKAITRLLNPAVRRATKFFEGRRFDHDCPSCKFLGRHKEHDLYFCPQGGLPTVIARYGNDGPEYTSGLTVATTHKGLLEAKRRATQKGYLNA